MFVPIGEWMPDSPAVFYGNNLGLEQADNLLWQQGAYQPIRALEDTGHEKLQGRLLETYSFETINGNYREFAFTELGAYVSVDGGWQRVYTLTNPAQNWEAVRFGPAIYAVNGITKVLALDVGNPQIQSFFELDASPTSAHTIGQAAGQLIVAVGAETFWSGINDPNVWSSTEKSSGGQFLPSGGQINQIVSYRRWLALQRETIQRFEPVVSDSVFARDDIEPALGSLMAKSAVFIGNDLFYISQSGFFKLNMLGAAPQPIGYGKVDRFFLDELHPTFGFRIRTKYDYANQSIWWHYTSRFSVDSYPDRFIIYNWRERKWSHYIDPEIAGLATHFQQGRTLDQITETLEELGETSLDSPIFRGGVVPQLYAIKRDGSFNFFSGAPIEATIRTKKHYLSAFLPPNPENILPPIRRMNLSRGGVGLSSQDYCMTVFARERISQEPGVSSGALQPEIDGFCPINLEGRVFETEIQIASGAEWDKLNTFYLNFNAEGQL